MSILPTAEAQHRPENEVINMPMFLETMELTLIGLSELIPFGTEVIFSQPLQRRAEILPGGGSRFWYEPSGGKNAAPFQGTVVGFRNLNVGETDCEGVYSQKASFPVLLLSFSPFRNPVPVLPWHTFRSAREYWNCRDSRS